MRSSGLQHQVLSLYRKTLKAARKKDIEYKCNDSCEFVRDSFRFNATDVCRTDFRTIEFLMRQGEKKLKLLSNPSTRGIRHVQVKNDKIQ